jgi:YggT family protein
MRILLFLLDTVFFVLVGAALLRAWMNSARLRMTQQPGIFAMAVTDWLVIPLRKTLPRRWVQANADWASLLAALLLALAYSVIWHGLVGGAVAGLGSAGVVVSLPLVAVTFVLRTALQGVMTLALMYAVLSWVQPQATAMGLLERLIEPLLRPLRRVLPQIGGLDLSVLVLIVLLQIGLMVLG